MTADVTGWSAVELVRRIRAKDLSAREAMAAHLERIAQVNPRLNAIVTLDADRALARAAEADCARRRSRRAARPAGRAQGSPAHERDEDDVRVADMA